jgi:hypothetical protein
MCSYKLLLILVCLTAQGCPQQFEGEEELLQVLPQCSYPLPIFRNHDYKPTLATVQHSPQKSLVPPFAAVVGDVSHGVGDNAVYYNNVK